MTLISYDALLLVCETISLSVFYFGTRSLPTRSASAKFSPTLPSWDSAPSSRRPALAPPGADVLKLFNLVTDALFKKPKFFSLISLFLQVKLSSVAP